MVKSRQLRLEFRILQYHKHHLFFTHSVSFTDERFILSEKVSILTTDNQDFECFTFTRSENIAGWQRFHVWWVCSFDKKQKSNMLC